MQTCVSNCTTDKYCDDLRKYLAAYGVDRTCANGSLPVDNFGTCADGSQIDCYSSYRVGPDLPSFAFPNEDVIFCYDNRFGDGTCLGIDICVQILTNAIFLKKFSAVLIKQYL